MSRSISRRARSNAGGRPLWRDCWGSPRRGATSARPWRRPSTPAPRRHRVGLPRVMEDALTGHLRSSCRTGRGGRRSRGRPRRPPWRMRLGEDEQIMAADLRWRLRRMGHTVVGTVAAGAEAVAQAPRRHPDVVRMDSRLHGRLDGGEAAERLRAPFDASPRCRGTAGRTGGACQPGRLPLPEFMALLRVKKHVEGSADRRRWHGASRAGRGA
jgi:hypothetical protein